MAKALNDYIEFKLCQTEYINTVINPYPANMENMVSS